MAGFEKRACAPRAQLSGWHEFRFAFVKFARFKLRPNQFSVLFNILAPPRFFIQKYLRRFYKHCIMSLRKTACHPFLILLFSTIIGTNLQAANLPPSDEYEYNRDAVKADVLAMECIVRPKYTTSVEGYLRGYLQRNRGKSERILGRMLKFFPLFDEYLEAHQMPSDLKYLAVVESALVPTAISRVGAGGLWQFMPETGNAYGLKISRYVDDRFDPQKSTEAAMKHLAKQYDRFGRWELALAAYNSGAGRVSRAIRHARSKDFWRLQRYLPRETRNYVPAFIAAKYMVLNYKKHGLKPEFPPLDIQLTERLRVYDYLSFKTIEMVTGLSRAVISELNPAYKRGFIPRSTRGNNLILPRRVMLAMKDYLESKRPDQPDTEDPDENLYQAYVQAAGTSAYAHAIYVVAPGDNMKETARFFNCSPYHLMTWNNLESDELTPGQELKIWYPNQLVRYRPMSGRKVETLPGMPINTFQPATKSTPGADPKPMTTYRLKRYESLADVARKFPKVSLRQLIEINGFSGKNPPVPGSVIRIPVQ
ncbi:MAG: LysM peptidoglycan-binding domain-containing protein [Bacteroidetes bacterium]|nr:MAG: LysM peptidoglycan-binding domain-containing protein [Bacteroidota bacterium]